MQVSSSNFQLNMMNWAVAYIIVELKQKVYRVLKELL